MSLLRLSAAVAATRADKVPPGWCTIAQLAAAEGLASSQGTFLYVVRGAVAAGILERQEFRIATASGVRRVAHYRRVK